MKMRINLLPTKFSRKRAGALNELIVMASVVVVTLIGLYVWHSVVGHQQSQLQQDILTVQNQIEKLKKEVVRVDDFKKKAKNLEDKLRVIDKLKARKTGPVKLLDDLATSITQVGEVWLEGLVEKDNLMTLDMYSLRQDKISEFMDTLVARSKHFIDVKLVITEAQKEKNITYFKFRVLCTVRYDV